MGQQVPLTISTITRENASVAFAITERYDTIQARLAAGEFYEEIELRKISALVGGDRVILDIGANIGNHALYFSKMMQAKQVYVVEPNDYAIAALKANIALNNISNINCKFLGLALSDRVGCGTMSQQYTGNLGSAQFQYLGFGNVPSLPGDLIFENLDFSLIKIDVEGMELRVLAGLQRTIERCRPWIFVEMHDKLSDEFVSWRSKMKYSVKWRHKRYSDNENFLLCPNELTE
ncbi:FkbM family methyltransferase [Rhizobium sullae]|uniref:FkbM family methyltransferase n=1 Tax=Rhizobium sullae TaxID=50338 RepID=UPI000B35CEC2|nr:FkbM family methyltransferase [Rhizobium sullae]